MSAPDEVAIAAQEAAIRGRYGDCFRAMPAGMGTSLPDAVIREQAIAELTRQPTPVSPSSSAPTGSLFVQKAQPDNAPLGALWVPVDDSGAPAPLDQWQVLGGSGWTSTDAVVAE